MYIPALLTFLISSLLSPFYILPYDGWHTVGRQEPSPPPFHQGSHTNALSKMRFQSCSGQAQLLRFDSSHDGDKLTERDSILKGLEQLNPT